MLGMSHTLSTSLLQSSLLILKYMAEFLQPGDFCRVINNVVYGARKLSLNLSSANYKQVDWTSLVICMPIFLIYNRLVVVAALEGCVFEMLGRVPYMY